MQVLDGSLNIARNFQISKFILTNLELFSTIRNKIFIYYLNSSIQTRYDLRLCRSRVCIMEHPFVLGL